MINAVRDYIRKKRLISPGSPLLLACSGGVDSMVLADVLSRLGYTVGLAHCNFELRGEESDKEQLWVEKYALEHQLPFFTINFNTKQFAAKNKITIQEAARFLRYTWLEDVRRINGYDHIVTAHQQNDQAETILQHIVKGTGLHGLQGIPARNGYIVRPMLAVPRKDILAYAAAHSLNWCEDSSNATTKYDRNYIRHEVMPLLEKLNPAVVQTFFDFSEKMQEAVLLTDEAIDRLLRRQVTEQKGIASMAVSFLKKHPAAGTILYHWLSPAGFSSDSLPDILLSLSAETSGQEFLSATHRLVRDRKRLYLIPLALERQDLLVVGSMPAAIHFNEWEITCSLLPRHELNMRKSSRYAYFDADKVEWPLSLRYWREGDYFYPFGLGKRQAPEKAGKKKLSKYFKDEKLSVPEKEGTPVLLSGEKIMWLVGQRADDRFKVTDKTKNVLKMAVTDGYEKE